MFLPNLTPEEVSILIKVLTGLAAIVTSVATTSWVMSKKYSYLHQQEKDLTVIKGIIFKEKGGLNVLTIDSHKELCAISNELHSKDMQLIKLAVGHIAKTVDEIKTEIKSNKEKPV